MTELQEFSLSFLNVLISRTFHLPQFYGVFISLSLQLFTRLQPCYKAELEKISDYVKILRKCNQ